MKAVNLFLLSREVPEAVHQEFECALSGRNKPIKYRPEEMELIRDMGRAFIKHGAPADVYDGWVYSFTIPQVGKEFDLLRITDSSVVNLELKSRSVDEARIEKQLIQNRYYLGHLKKEIYSFTLLRDDSGRLKLYRYEDGLKRGDMRELLKILIEQTSCITENIEELFDPCVYLVSPINTPDRFLNREYFLNSQQSHIKNEIIQKKSGLFGIKGSAGTGKTLLLYDIALELGKTRKTCVVHGGVLSEGHIYLSGNEDAFDVISAKDINADTFSSYEAICVDETQRLHTNELDKVLAAYERKPSKLCVFSYDFQQSLSIREIKRNNPKRLNDLEHFQEYNLTDKIRTNDEISSFIKTMMRLSDRPKKEISYDRVDVVYANDMKELKAILQLYSSKGYKYIMPAPSRYASQYASKYASQYAGDRPDYYTASGAGQFVIEEEFDQVVVVMDANFKYDENGELTAFESPDPDYLFQKLLYQNITRARKRLCLAVYDNPELLGYLLAIKNYTLFKKN